MNPITFILIAVGIFTAIFALFLFGKADTKTSNSNANQVGSTALAQRGGAPNRIDGKKTVKTKEEKGVTRKDIFNFMEFDKISDNMIIQEKSNKFTMVIQCKGINYDLMSEVEQLAIEEGFITFLNTLKYPIQLYVQARAVDLKNSMNIYKQNMETLKEQYNNADDEYNRLAKSVDVDFASIKAAKNERAKKAHILDYAQDITKYVERLSLNKHILQRKFYVVLSYHKNEVASVSEFSKEEVYDICSRELTTRAQSLIGALASCSVQGKILNSNELAELLYISYNRDDEKLLDIRTALESGFYRLYSTSKDVFEKKEEKLQKEIEEAAYERVKEALIENMRMQHGLTEEELIEEFEERADREALNIINTAEMSDDERRILNDIIASRHVIESDKRRRARMAVKELKEYAKNQTGETGKKEDVTNQQIAEDKTEEKNEEQLVSTAENQSEHSEENNDESIV